MHIKKMSINGNPNVGLYVYATDSYAIVGRDVSPSQAEEIGKILDVPIFHMNIAGTSLVGVFLAGNDKCLLVPSIAFDSEIKKIDEISKKIGFHYEIINTDLTALGNNILCNNKGCMVNPDFPKAVREEIANAVKVPTKEGKIAGLPTVGSLAAMNDKGCAIHRDSEKFEIDFVSSLLDIECEEATVNLGNPFVKSGIIVTNKGFIVGSASGGPEIVYLEQLFGFSER
jgi:translation initiation factor 6